MTETIILQIIALVIMFLAGLVLGIILCDKLANRYHQKEIERLKAAHESELTTQYMDGYHAGVKAGGKLASSEQGWRKLAQGEEHGR